MVTPLLAQVVFLHAFKTDDFLANLLRAREAQAGVYSAPTLFRTSEKGYTGAIREPDAVSNAINCAKFYSRSHHAVIRIYDDAGNVIETHKHDGDFKEW